MLTDVEFLKQPNCCNMLLSKSIDKTPPAIRVCACHIHLWLRCYDQ